MHLVVTRSYPPEIGGMQNLMWGLTNSLSKHDLIKVFADDHDNAVKNAKEKFANHPNHLLSFKDCKETKDGVGGLLELSDSVWKKIEMDPDDEESWMEVAVLADLAANYSTIYDVWCKDMINKRVKMRMMADKKKAMKKGKAKDN